VSTRIAAGAVVLALAGCGGGSAAPRSATNSTPTAAGTAAAQKLIKRAFGPNRAASSGVIDGTIDVQVTGIRRFAAEPVTLSFSGPFGQPSDGAAPEAHLSLGLTVPQGLIGGDLILTGNGVLFALGSSAYRLPANLADPVRVPLVGARNALTAVLGVFGIAPQHWGTRPRIVGDEPVDGTPVIHLTDRINVKHFFGGAARFAMVLKTLHATGLALLPEDLTPAIRAALVRSVTASTGDLYIGSADHVVRRAKARIQLKPSPADRRLLGGIAGLRIDANLHVTEVGSRPKISVPTNRQPYAELKLLLETLTTSARKLAKH
jgi:hypothetical protein